MLLQLRGGADVDLWMWRCGAGVWEGYKYRVINKKTHGMLNHLLTNKSTYYLMFIDYFCSIT